MSEKKPKIKSKKELLKEYTETLKRTQADFENYIKRSNKEKEQITNVTKSALLIKFLNTLDDFERSISFIKRSQNKEIINGISIVFKNFSKILEEEGVKPIEAIGKKYDHNLHEVIKQQSNDKEEGTIIEEIQKGYFLNGRVLRHSKVIISDGGKKNE